MASRQHIKASLEESVSKPTVEQAPNCLETPWHYVTIGYNGHQLGLLVDTDDEEEAQGKLKTSAPRWIAWRGSFL